MTSTVSYSSVFWDKDGEIRGPTPNFDRECYHRGNAERLGGIPDSWLYDRFCCFLLLDEAAGTSDCQRDADAFVVACKFSRRTAAAGWPKPAAPRRSG